MILTCPECSARYLVDPKALLPNGRVVRCAKCKHSWRESAPDQEIPQVAAAEAEGPANPPARPETDAGQPPPEPPTDDSPGAEEDDFALKRPPRQKRPRPIPKGSNLPALQDHKHQDSLWGWYGLAAFIAIIVSSFMFFQPTISEVWPPSKKLYRAMGMDESRPTHSGNSKKAEPAIPLEKLFRIEDTIPSKVIDGEVITLKVEGKIVGLSDETRRLPLLKIALKDDQGATVREWTFKSSAATISPDEIVPFYTSLPNPPETATSISVTFAEN